MVDRQRLRQLFEAISPLLYEYPAIAPERFRERLDAALRPA